MGVGSRPVEKDTWSLMPGEVILVRSEPFISEDIKWWLIFGIPTLTIGFFVAGWKWLY